MLAFTGCSLLHHHSAPPQQQFLTALKRGDSMQANLIWLNMNAEDRANLSHSIGITPQASPGEIKAQLARHAREKAEEDGEGGGEMVDHAQFETGELVWSCQHPSDALVAASTSGHAHDRGVECAHWRSGEVGVGDVQHHGPSQARDRSGKERGVRHRPFGSEMVGRFEFGV